MKQFSAKKPHCNVLNFKNGITILKGVVIFLLFISVGATARTINGSTAPGKTTSVNAPGCVAAFTDSTSDRVAYFTSTSSDTDANTEYLWNFGDGGISHQVNPTHRYDSAGTYTVCLIIKNTVLSCLDSVCQTVTITQCQASFTTLVDTLKIKDGFSYITLTSNSTGVEPGTSYRYSNDTVPDGGPHSSSFSGYAPPGAYQICLTIQNTNTGCLSTFCDTVKVPLIPSSCNANFTFDTTGNTATFTDASTGTSAFTRYDWTFSDGGISHQQNPIHHYSAGGTYYVCETITDTSVNYCNSTFCQNVTISASVGSCQAAFDTAVTNNVLTVTSTSTDVGINTVYRWVFGDGNIGHQPVQSHAYTTAGTYNVCLTIRDTVSGCTSTFCENVTVSSPGTCQAAFDTAVTANLLTVTSTSTGVGVNTVYDWNFGDGNIGHQPSQSHTYASAGTYNVCLTIKDTVSGCTNQFCENVTVTLPVTPTCQAAFDTTMIGNLLTVTSTSTGVTINTVYDWNFGDGNIGHQASQTHTYATSGTYNVCLTTKDTVSGCTSTFCENVITIPYVSSCTASFDTVVTNGTLMVTSTSTGTDANTKYDWTFGDGGIGHQPSQSHIYTLAGKYDVCLTISNSSTGCSSQVCDSVTITLPCQAGFDTLNVNGLTVTFKNASTGNNNNTDYFLNYGDGNNPEIFDFASETHTYASPGTYNVCLFMDNFTTGCTSTFCENVTVPITCNPTFDTSVAVGTTMTFTNTTVSSDSSRIVYGWNFGDGNSELNKSRQVTHAYTTPGTYDVCLFMANPITNCDNEFCENVVIPNGGCTAAFTDTSNGLTALFTNASTGVDGSTIYRWYFGDDSISHQQNPTHHYSATGTYTACLVISTPDLSCSDSVCHTVTIITPLSSCGAAFTDTSNGLKALFTSTSTDTTATTVYRWNFGDGGVSHQVNPIHNYADTGSYTVCLTITDTAAIFCDSTICQTIHVTSINRVNVCGADFINSSSGLRATFTSTSTDTTSATQYHWAFGDGGISHQVNPIHNYKAGGKYDVCLTITDSTLSFCDSTFCDSVTITAPVNVCGADFSSSSTGLLANFTSTSTDTTVNTKYNWAFGDGGISHQVNPIHHYKTGGKYEVCLTITDSTLSFCDSTFCDSVTITAPVNVCGADFSSSSTGLLANFTSTSTDTTVNTKYNWAFGDGGISHQVNPIHHYKTGGKYDVCLTITDSTLSFCDSTFCDSITIAPLVSTCQAAFDTSVNVNRLTVTSTSTGVDINTVYTWNFGDDSIGHQASQSHTYKVPGTYNVCLTISNLANGCYSQFCENVTTAPFVSTCQAAFDTSVAGNLLTVTSTSTGVSGNTVYTWNFGDGGIGHQPSQPHTYATAGTYNVCLTISNAATGCNSQFCENVTTAPFVSTCQASFDTSVNNRTVTLTSTSTGTNANTTYDWSFGDGGISHQQNPVHTYPSEGICSSEITLTNSQGSATPTGFQQQVIINSSLFSANESAGLQNVEFTAGGPVGTGTPLNAWLESGDSSTSTNTTWWVNLGSNIIPANGSITIYINFMPSSVMSASGITGEAPQLSTNYGQYDNGSIVFPFYDNFAGTTLSGNWTSYASGTGTLVVDNGLTITSEYSDAEAANVITSVNSYPANVVAETYVNGSYAIGGTRSYMPGLITNTAANEGVWVGDGPFSTGDDGGEANPTGYVSFSNGRTAIGIYAFLEGAPTSSFPYADYDDFDDYGFNTGYNVWSLIYTGSTNSLYQNYTDVVDGNSSFSPTGNLYFALGIAEYGASSASTFSSYWARTRQDAPNNVMPSATVGSLSCQAPANKYDVCLTISNIATGCYSTTCDSVTLLPFVSSCQAAFSNTDTNLVATFTNSSTGTDANTTYTWNFGDGGVSHQQNPIHRYTNGGGAYTACLTISNLATGCFDSICQDVIITQCQASFDTLVNDRKVQFTSTSTDTTDSTHYFWSFGDGKISHQENPIHVYSDTAKSACFAMITLNNGQSSATPTGFQQQVTVNSSLYSASELAGLQNVEFTVGGPLGSGTPLSAWLESGNTNTSTSTVWWVNLGSAIIPANGSLPIYMNFLSSTVMSASGITGEAPQLSATYGQYDNGALVFPFYDNFAGTTLSSNWTTFSGGTGITTTVNNGLTMTAATGSGVTPVADVISSASSYPNNLVAESYISGTPSESGTRSYEPGLISTTAAAEGINIADENGGVPTASYLCFSDGRSFGAYSWLQGNTSTSGADYNEYQTYTPGYNVYSLFFSPTTNYLYLNYTQVATGDPTYSPPAGNMYFALGLAANYGPGLSTPASLSAYWTRIRQYPPNGVMPDASSGSLSCEPPGTFDVCLTISNSVTGCSSQSCENVTVAPAVNVCGADFTNTTGGKLVNFTSTSTDTTIYTNYKWTFGDGDISHQVNPHHTYADTGMYTVCLTITDTSESFCDSTFCNTIHVTNVNVCGADFTDTSNGTLAEFTSTSTGTSAATQYKWSFGDGGISHQVNPQHTYGAAGKYDVCLTITDSSGAFCDSTFCDSITITSPVSVCSPDFTFTTNNLKVNFTSTSTDTTTATLYRWHFGDDSISHQRNPQHLYKQAGTYSVCLTLLDSTLSYCDSTICKDVTVSSPTSECSAGFTWVNVKGQGVHFYSDSKDTSTATKYSWNLGDGTVLQNEVDPSHRYQASGDYYVCLTITDSTETYCNSTFCDSVDFVLSGIEQLSFPGTSLYYDPSTSQIVLNWVGNDNVTIHLVDMLGRDAQDIYIGNLSTGTYRFNVSSSIVASGIYFVHMTANDGDKAWKIFVLPH